MWPDVVHAAIMSSLNAFSASNICAYHYSLQYLLSDSCVAIHRYKGAHVSQSCLVKLSGSIPE